MSLLSDENIEDENEESVELDQISESDSDQDSLNNKTDHLLRHVQLSYNNQHTLVNLVSSDPNHVISKNLLVILNYFILYLMG